MSYETVRKLLRKEKKILEKLKKNQNPDHPIERGIDLIILLEGCLISKRTHDRCPFGIDLFY